MFPSKDLTFGLVGTDRVLRALRGFWKVLAGSFALKVCWLTGVRFSHTLGHGYVRCCHVGQSHFGQTPLAARRGRGEMKQERKAREGEGKEQSGEVEQEEIDKKGHRARGEPDSMPRLATEEGQGGTKEGKERRKEESRVPGRQASRKGRKGNSGRDKTNANLKGHTDVKGKAKSRGEVRGGARQYAQAGSRPGCGE